MTGITTLTIELFSTETNTAETRTPIRSRLETSTFSGATRSALKIQPQRARLGSSSPPATCRLYLRRSNVGLLIPISSSPKYVVSNGLLPGFESGVEVTPYPDKQLPKCPALPGTQSCERRLLSYEGGSIITPDEGRKCRLDLGTVLHPNA